MRLLIHGGYFKTGTTAFQKWLHASRDSLAGLGIHVPHARSHDNHGFELSRSIRNDPPDETIWIDLDAARESGYSFAILSGEAVGSYFPEDFALLHSRARRFDPLLFFVLRRWEDYLPSTHDQHVNRGDWLTLPEFLALAERDYARHSDIDFGIPYTWAHDAGFRDMAAISYGRNAPVELVSALTGFDAAELERAHRPQTGINARRDALMMRRVRLMNAIVGSREGLSPGHVYRGNLEPGLTPHYLLLPEIMDRLVEQAPDLMASLDEAMAPHEATISMADHAARFDGWRDDLKDTLSRLGVDDRLGEFDGPDDPPKIATNLARLEQIAEPLRDRIYQQVVATRREVWSERLKNRGQPGRPRPGQSR